MFSNILDLEGALKIVYNQLITLQVAGWHDLPISHWQREAQTQSTRILKMRENTLCMHTGTVSAFARSLSVGAATD